MTIFLRLVENDRKVLLIFSVVFCFLIGDTIINYVSDLIVPYLISIWNISFFASLVVVNVIGIYLILEFIRVRSKEIRAKDPYLKTTHIIVTVVQCTLLAIVIFILSEIIIQVQYHTSLLTVFSAITQILTIGILGLFSLRFFLWFNLNRSSVIVLFYGLSFATLAFSLAIISSTDLYLLPQKQSVINPTSEVIFPYDYIEPGSFIDNLFLLYDYTSIVSFILLVCATAVLLRHYAKRIGKIKFYVFITLPLLYFLSATIERLGLYTPATDTEWFYWWLYISLNSTAGGALFGLAFWTVAKSIRQDSPVKQYLIISAYGFVLLFISSQIGLVGAPYPPVGIVTMSFLPLGSYMIFLGVYSTAISISHDNQLRKSIRKIVSQDSNLLSSIGSAEMEREIQRTVSSMKDVVQEQEKELEEQTGIEANLEEDEMKKYLEEVMQEVGKAKKPSA